MNATTTSGMILMRWIKLLILTDLCSLRTQEHYKVDGDRSKVAGLRILDIDVSFDFALLSSLFGLFGFESSLFDSQLAQKWTSSRL